MKRIRLFIAILLATFAFLSAGTVIAQIESGANVTPNQTIAVPPVQSVTDTGILFSENFTQYRRPWDRPGDHRNYSHTWDNTTETLILSDKRPDMYYNPYYLRENFTDFRLDVDSTFSNISGEDSYIAVISRRTDSTNFYAFLVFPSGEFVISKREQGDIVTLHEREYSEYIDATANHIQIECVGDRLNLSVNGHPLASVQDDYQPIRDGIIGFGAFADELGEGYTTVVLDNLVISVPGTSIPPTPTPTPTPTPPRQEASFQDNFSAVRSPPWIDLSSPPNGSIAYENGSVILTDSPGGLPTVYLLNQTFGDFILDIDAEMIEGDSSGTTITVACRLTESFSDYEFEIMDNVYFISANSETGSYLLDFNITTRLNLNPGVKNHITIGCVGDRLNLSVNGLPLSTVTDDAIESGRIALLVRAGENSTADAVVAFDNLIVAPPGATAVPPTPTNTTPVWPRPPAPTNTTPVWPR